MPTGPKDLTSKFFPGLSDQHVVGAAGVGIHVVDTTVEAGTVKTNAQVIAAPSNVTGKSYGAVVHSLRIAPSFAFAQLTNQNGVATAMIERSIQFEYITADISAVYIRATSFTLPTGPISVRVVVVR